MILLTPDDAAEFLSLATTTLADWRWQRKGPPWIPISRGCVRYSKEALEAWLERRTIVEIKRAA